MPSNSSLSKFIPFTSVGILIALLYVGWTFYSRSQSARDAREENQRKQEEAQKRSNSLIFGDGSVKLLVFSTSEGHVRRGQSTNLCYGVVNATKVSIEPSIGEETKPTSRHCVDISPKQTTTYQLKASNTTGQEQTASLTVRVE